MNILTRFGIDRGLSVCACLAETGVSEKALGDPYTLVSADQEIQLIRNLVQLLGREPWLGLEAGLRYRFSAFGMLGFALVSSQTTREAIDVAIRYFDLTFALARFRVADIGDETLITFHGDHLAPDVRHFIIERDCAALMNIQREISPSIRTPPIVEFARPRPGDTSAYVPVFGREPLFDTAVTRLILDRQQLLQPLPQANRLAQMMAEAQCRLMLDRHRTRGAVSAKVRDRLAEERARMPGMEAIADAFNMTSRTLRRHLEKEGTTFEKLRDEVRMMLAEEMLRQTDLSVGEISTTVSYASPSPFIKAFKVWAGVTPLQYRQQYRPARNRHIENGGCRKIL